MSAFESIPNDLEQQATVMGANGFQIFFSILLPLAIPGLAAAALYTFLLSWDEFIFSYFLLGLGKISTLTLYLKQKLSYSPPQNLLATISVCLSVPVIVFLCCCRIYDRGYNLGFGQIGGHHGDVVVKGISKYFGDHQVISTLDLEVKSGEFVTLLGPSGCGKTTLLRMIAGLEKLTKEIFISAADGINDIPAQRRHVAMVFQSYALFPHMSCMTTSGSVEDQESGEGRNKRKCAWACRCSILTE